MIKQRSTTPRRVFLLRRLARLAPLYYLGILIYGLVLSPPEHGNLSDPWIGIVNLTFVNGWIPGQANAIVPGGWSISAEAAFALLLVGIVPWVSTIGRAFWLTILGWGATWATTGFVSRQAAEMVGQTSFGIDVEYFPWTYMPTFIAGIWCWHLWNRRELNSGSATTWVRVACGAAAVLLFLIIPFHNSWTVYRTLIVGPASALLLYAWTSGPLIGPWLWPLHWLGRLSFGIYLMHFELIGVAKVFAVGLLPLETPSLVLFATTLLVTLVCTVPLAWASWIVIEQPVHAFVIRATSPQQKLRS